MPPLVRQRAFRGDNVKKKIKNILLIVLALVIAIGCGAYSLLFDTQRLEGGELICQSDSPENKYTVSAYLNRGEENNAVLCRVTAKIFLGRDRNIYWNYPCESAEIEWIDETTVIINGVELDVRFDTFDYRKSKEAA